MRQLLCQGRLEELAEAVAVQVVVAHVEHAKGGEGLDGERGELAHGELVVCQLEPTQCGEGVVAGQQLEAVFAKVIVIVVARGEVGAVDVRAEKEAL